MISVRHWLLSVGELGARSSPVQVKDNIHSMIIDPLNKVSDGIDIVLATILRLYPVDTSQHCSFKGILTALAFQFLMC